MHGNLWEYCQDWYGNYPNRQVDAPLGASKGTKRVVRGGSWHPSCVAAWCRSAMRGAVVPDSPAGNHGFRVLMEPVRFVAEGYGIDWEEYWKEFELELKGIESPLRSFFLGGGLYAFSSDYAPAPSLDDVFGTVVLANTDAPIGIEKEKLEDGLVALKCNGLYLPNMSPRLSEENKYREVAPLFTPEPGRKDFISFELANKPGFYLRHHTLKIVNGDSMGDSPREFQQASTWRFHKVPASNEIRNRLRSNP